ncbi:MAG: hypothetical protein HKN91_03925 [Acidimicrobiia bacterium]|nr:hypothetical protein [Acidimicrobiia bacterium]
MPADDHLRDLFDEMGIPPEPTSEQEAAARARLRSAIRDEAIRTPLRLGRRPALAFGAAALSITAAIVAITLVLPGSSPAVDANLAGIAGAARSVVAEELPAGAYVYTHRESSFLSGAQANEDSTVLFYLLPETVDTWTRDNSKQITTTIGTPIFFDTKERTAYYAAGIDESDGVGTTTTEDFVNIPGLLEPDRWSTDVDVLRQQVAAELAVQGATTSNEDARMLAFVTQLLDPNLNPSPQLRAAIIELIGGLNVTTVMLPSGFVNVTLEYADPVYGSVRHEMELDEAGNLRATRIVVLAPGPDVAIPAGTVIEMTDWSVAAIVDSPGSIPAG